MNRWILSALALSLGTAALASPPREIRADHQELRDDRSDFRDDIRDARGLDHIVDRWHAAWRAGDRAAERAADQDLGAWLVREVGESIHEVHEGRVEARHSAAESRASDARIGSTPLTGRAAREARDDRQDARDDRRDAHMDAKDVARTRAIARELRAMQPSFTAGTATAAQYGRKSVLLGELKAMTRAEVKANVQEAREDRREWVEDVR